MTLKPFIVALLALCTSLLAETPVASVAAVDSVQSTVGVAPSEPSAEADEDSADEVDEASVEDETQTVMTPLVKGKTGIESLDTLSINEWDIPTTHNSLKYAMLFSLLPGGGQYYTEHYVRGGFLTGFELLLIYDIFFNRSFQRDRLLERAATFQDSVQFFSSRELNSPRDSIQAYHSKRLEFLERVRAQSDKKMEQEDVRKAELAWLIGIHIYGIFDTYGIWYNNNYRSYEYRDMKKAVLWALLPGGGQIFNRDFGKAGLVYMGLLGAAVSVSTSQNMVNYYLDRKHLVEKESPSSEEYERITERVTYYRKNRNTYIWGAVLIYLYSIADAAVDALLSDFDNPMHLAIAPNFDGGAQAVLSLDF